jgi:hypothetical protein
MDGLIGQNISDRGEHDVLETMLNDDAEKIVQQIVDLFCDISDLSDLGDDDLEDVDE